MNKTVTVQLYFKTEVRLNGDGYYPVVTNDDLDGSVYETFYLNDDGIWNQKYIYDEPVKFKELKETLGENYISREVHMHNMSIRDLDHDNGIKLLKLLNDETKRLQLEGGICESEIKQGFTIMNINGIYIYRRISSDVPH